MNSQLQFQITDLRQQNLQTLLESVSVFIASLIAASLLPSLLMQYVYKDQSAFMTEAPFWVQNGPLIIFGVGLLYFVYAVVVVLMRSKKINQLKQQLLMTYSQPSFSDAEISEQQAELAKLEKMVDEALQQSTPAAKSKKVSKAKKK